MQKQKLELTWVGKNNLPNVEPRILMHDKNFDYGDTDTENILTLNGEKSPTSISGGMNRHFFVDKIKNVK